MVASTSGHKKVLIYIQIHMSRIVIFSNSFLHVKVEKFGFRFANDLAQYIYLSFLLLRTYLLKNIFFKNKSLFLHSIKIRNWANCPLPDTFMRC